MTENKKIIKLEDIGFSDFFKKNREFSNDDNFTPARIIAEHKELYILKNEVSELSAKITGKMMFTASSREDYPAVGDWVLITILDKEQAVIHEILPRKTILKRKASGKSDIQIIASNIDVAFIVESPDRDYSLNRFERYFSLANSEKIKPIIILNKIDLISDSDLDMKVSEIEDRFKDINIYSTSTITRKGIDNLKKEIKKGLTYCFIGSSGVGKSSIVNMLVGQDLIRTGEISSYTNRGKHVTTHRELFVLENGGLLIDNPGMREVGLTDSDTGIRNTYIEIRDLSENCRFSNCSHVQEPGCAVLEAIQSGELDNDKYENYMKLVKENEYNTMTKLEKREKDRRFGKFINQAKKQTKKFK